MALNEIQWGQILALAWLNEDFKMDFEIDPAKALKDLRTKDSPLRNSLQNKNPFSEDILDDLGIDDNSPLIDLERIVEYPVDFSGAPEAMLLKIIAGNDQSPVKMEEAPWYWGWREGEEKHGIATKVEKDTLKGVEWGQIYACIWKDERFGGPDKKNYKAQFERDPAQIVKEIAKEVNSDATKSPITYTENVTRLFAVIPKPTEWEIEPLERVVKTGKVNGYPLVWMVTKSC
jgi:hypothetical protein